MKEIKLSHKQISTIERSLTNGKKVELTPTKDRVIIAEVTRRKIE